MTNLIKCAYKPCQPFMFMPREIKDHFYNYCSEGCYDAAQEEKKNKKKNHHKKSEDEAINIAKIHTHIKDNTPCGQKIKAAFRETFPDLPMFETTVVSGADRKTHHDLKLKWGEHENISKETVEHKGSEKKSKIDPSQPPWICGVQFYNCPANLFKIGHVYARKFYDTMIDDIINYFKIITTKPSYEEWTKDAFKQGKPTTPFGRELYEKGYKHKYLSECRKKFNSTFTLTDAELEEHQSEVFQKANEVLQQKDFWLQIHGKMDEPDDFEVRWSGAITVAPFVKATLKKTNCHIIYIFKCADGAEIQSMLRWGYGQCITNLRVDLK